MMIVCLHRTPLINLRYSSVCIFKLRAVSTERDRISYCSILFQISTMSWKTCILYLAIQVLTCVTAQPTAGQFER
jgi:hypothetical protein